jgi:hypothetical protein
VQKTPFAQVRSLPTPHRCALAMAPLRRMRPDTGLVVLSRISRCDCDLHCCVEGGVVDVVAEGMTAVRWAARSLLSCDAVSALLVEVPW